MTRIGGKNDPGLLYVHVALDGCFTAAGFYDPAPETLARLTRRHDADAEGLEADAAPNSPRAASRRRRTMR